jgi:hypothetical protein
MLRSLTRHHIYHTGQIALLMKGCDDGRSLNFLFGKSLNAGGALFFRFLPTDCP